MQIIRLQLLMMVLMSARMTMVGVSSVAMTPMTATTVPVTWATALLTLHSSAKVRYSANVFCTCRFKSVYLILFLMIVHVQFIITVRII